MTETKLPTQTGGTGQVAGTRRRGDRASPAGQTAAAALNAKSTRVGVPPSACHPACKLRRGAVRIAALFLLLRMDRFPVRAGRVLRELPSPLQE